MRLFSIAHFGWDEPKEFVRLHDAFRRSSESKWKRAAVSISLIAMAVINFLITWDKDFDPSNVFISSMILLFSTAPYATLWLAPLFPSEIHFYDDHIARVRGSERKKIKYANIESVSWRVADEFATLILREKEAEEEIFIGVPLRYPRERVEGFLSERARRRR